MFVLSLLLFSFLFDKSNRNNKKKRAEEIRALPFKQFNWTKFDAKNVILNVSKQHKQFSDSNSELLLLFLVPLFFMPLVTGIIMYRVVLRLPVPKSVIGQRNKQQQQTSAFKTRETQTERGTITKILT